MLNEHPLTGVWPSGQGDLCSLEFLDADESWECSCEIDHLTGLQLNCSLNH